MAAHRKDIMPARTMSIRTDGEIKQILQLKQKPNFNRKVAELLSIGRNTVNEYVRFLTDLDKSFEELLSMDESDLRDLFP